jgi:lipopolysaccharide exporter
VTTVFSANWQPMWPMLAILSVLSVVRPVAWIVAPYLQVYDRPGTMMRLEVSKTVLLLASLVALGLAFGPLAACAAPGIAFAFNAVANLWVVQKMEQRVSIGSMLWPLLPPVLACAPMVAAVIGVRHALEAVGPLPRLVDGPLGAVIAKVIELGAEIVVGAAAFVGAAFLVARAASRDFIELLRGARRRGKSTIGPSSEPGGAAAT